MNYKFKEKLACSIIKHIMNIIDCNINVIDARGRIIGSDDRERVSGGAGPLRPAGHS
ncbi:hypothetical protein AAEU23_004908 [Escherichia coli]